MPTDRDLTSILLPCWNAEEMTRVCVERLLRLTARPFELILIDNGCAPTMRRWLRSVPGATLLRNARNLGYAKAINQGLARARGRTVLLANTDAFATPLWLEGMLEALGEDAAVGGVSPLTNAIGTAPIGLSTQALACVDLLAEGLRKPGPALAPARGFVPAFWFLLPRSVFDAVGPLDENCAAPGYADFDLQYRMRRSGYKIGFARKAYVHHVWSGSVVANGLSPLSLYGRRRLNAFHRGHPGSETTPVEVRTPSGATFPAPSTRKEWYSAARA
ncbi:MAG: glycosyltransferase family 2 protein [Elusimicrobiota bacterium]